MAHQWWNRGEHPEEDLYARWAALQDQPGGMSGYREDSWQDPGFRRGAWLGDILGQRMRYSGEPEADAYVAALQGEMASRPEQAGTDMPMGISREEAAYGGLPTTDITPPEAVEKIIPKKEEKKKTRSDLEKLFLYELMANMRGGDIGQAPAVVTGGPQRPFPTMMRQFAPWEREKPYWWIR